MSSKVPAALRATVIGRWHHQLSNNTSTRRNHWQTKVRYFAAVERLLTSRPDGQLTWRTIVSATAPDGARSTFYEVAGSSARHSMVDALIRDGRSDAIQLALRYRRSEAVAQLLDETKVWSFWPYRVSFLARPEPTPDALDEAVRSWARDVPELAAALDHTPPACAVEDLMVLHDGLLPAIRAAALLSEQVRLGAASAWSSGGAPQLRAV
jgi:hypothetical protein